MKEGIRFEEKIRWHYVGMALLLVAFEADVIATAVGTWKGGLISKYVFYVLFVAGLFVVLHIIPENINAAAKAKELEIARKRLEVKTKAISKGW